MHTRNDYKKKNLQLAGIIIIKIVQEHIIIQIIVRYNYIAAFVRQLCGKVPLCIQQPPMQFFTL